jgi:hypothetical protein
LKAILPLTLWAGLLFAFTGANSGRGPSALVSAPVSALPKSLPAISWHKGAAELERIDPLTLRRVSRRGAAVGRDTSAWSYSPDRKRLVLANANGDAALRFVDLRRLTSLGRLEIDRSASIAATAWVSPRRVLALEQTSLLDVLVVDPVRRRVISSRMVHGLVEAVGRTKDGLAALLMPEEGLGPSRLVVVDSRGAVRSVVLDQIVSGYQLPPEGTPGTIAKRRAGLAIDAEHGRAYVVGAGEPLAEVDLSTLAVTYHPLSQHVSFFSRLREWLEPPAEAKTSDGPERDALWLGGGLIAVSGFEGNAAQELETPAGLVLIDTRDWSLRTLDTRVSHMAAAGGTLLGYASTWDAAVRRDVGVGLEGFDLGGALRFHLFGHKAFSQFSEIQVLGGSAYVSWGRNTRVVDLSSGAVRTLRVPLPQLLVGS